MKVPARSIPLFLAFVAALCTLIFVSCDGRKESVFQKNIIWDPREDSVEGYRIPGIVATPHGTLLAFAEQRPVYGDKDPKSLVLKRSTDKGLTWSENIYVERADGSYWSDHQEQIDPDDAPDKREVWTNIAPLVDRDNGRIFFFYALSEGGVAGENLQRYTRVFYRYSDDDGLSWSDRTDVTDILNSRSDGTPNRDEDGNWITDENGFACDYLGRAFHMPGPGHGIQLSSGRLLLQVWNRKALGIKGKGIIPKADRRYGICTMYSDDHGKTWKYGSSFGHAHNMNESRIVELENGNLYLNARYSGEKNNHRAVAVSRDGGISWEDERIDESFPVSSNCDAGLISLQGNEVHYLLYSKNESGEGRKNLVVRLSADDGDTWPVVKVVDEGPAKYSDMAVLSDKTVLLIYETVKNGPVYGVRFNLDWLRDNP